MTASSYVPETIRTVDLDGRRYWIPLSAEAEAFARLAGKCVLSLSAPELNVCQCGAIVVGHTDTPTRRSTCTASPHPDNIGGVIEYGLRRLCNGGT